MAPGHLFRQMEAADAGEISGWRYEPPYDFHNSDADLAELPDPERRRDAYFSVLDDEGRLVGFFQFENEGEAVDVGLRPDLTGRGFRVEFVRAGLAFARERFSPGRFTLPVATFNARAIRTYERAGFRRDGVYMHETNGGEYEFLRMGREA